LTSGLSPEKVRLTWAFARASEVFIYCSPDGPAAFVGRVETIRAYGVLEFAAAKRQPSLLRSDESCDPGELTL